MQSIFEQACELLWVHINPLVEEERKMFINGERDNLPNSIEDYKTFKEQLIEIIKEKVIIRDLALFDDCCDY